MLEEKGEGVSTTLFLISPVYYHFKRVICMILVLPLLDMINFIIYIKISTLKLFYVYILGSFLILIHVVLRFYLKF